jgi:hypothetical protein
MRSVNRVDRGMLLAWMALIGATVGSGLLGLDTVCELSPSASLMNTGLIALAAFKMRLIGLYFMELRHAPLLLRIAFEACILGVCCGVLGFYLAMP